MLEFFKEAGGGGVREERLTACYQLRNLKHISLSEDRPYFYYHTDEDGGMEGGACYATQLEDEKASLESSGNALFHVTYLFIIYLRSMFPLDRAGA